MNVNISFDDYLQEVKEVAANFGAHNYCDSYEDLDDETKTLIKEKFKSIDNFCYVSNDDFEQQLKDYGDGYMGEDAKVGDLMWFDGECLCCESTVENWHIDSQPQKGVWLDWQDCAELIKERMILEIFAECK